MMNKVRMKSCSLVKGPAGGGVSSSLTSWKQTQLKFLFICKITGDQQRKRSIKICHNNKK